MLTRHIKSIKFLSHIERDIFRFIFPLEKISNAENNNLQSKGGFVRGYCAVLNVG